MLGLGIRSIRSLFIAAAMAFLAILLMAAPAVAQQAGAAMPVREAGDLPGVWDHTGFAENPAAQHSFTAAIYLHGYSLVRPPERSSLLAKPSLIVSPGTIAKMESAFYCNDTPFVDQVQLPVASLWGGRVKLIGSESDVTTANFVLGLPGAGTLQSLSLMGSGHLATRTPPSDQLVSMHMRFYLHGGEVEAQDNSGLHGMQYLVRAGRDFLQTFVAH